jgi:phosphonate transport system ATP-binding protein
MLRIDSLTKRYKTGDKALNGVSFDVPAGQVVGLIGPSGAGKSTLIRCINRLVEPNAGRVLLNDSDITRLGRHDLRRARRRMGMIFQEYALVERLSVMENVLSGRLGYVPFWRSFLRRFPQSDVDKAFTLLARVGLSDHADKRASALSGGQRQRVGEPTASLDPKTARQIMRLICEVCRERNLPAIISLHDVLLAKMFVDRIIGLRAGEIVFDGAPSKLNTTTLTEIYGEEDWTEMHDEAEEAAAHAPKAHDLEPSREERMAGLA